MNETRQKTNVLCLALCAGVMVLGCQGKAPTEAAKPAVVTEWKVGLALDGKPYRDLLSRDMTGLVKEESPVAGASAVRLSEVLRAAGIREFKYVEVKGPSGEPVRIGQSAVEDPEIRPLLVTFPTGELAVSMRQGHRPQEVVVRGIGSFDLVRSNLRDEATGTVPSVDATRATLKVAGNEGRKITAEDLAGLRTVEVERNGRMTKAVPLTEVLKHFGVADKGTLKVTGRDGERQIALGRRPAEREEAYLFLNNRGEIGFLGTPKLAKARPAQTELASHPKRRLDKQRKAQADGSDIRGVYSIQVTP